MSSPAQSRPIRVLVVDDSAFMRTSLSRIISSDPNFEVAGTAVCGADALEKIPVLDPDVVTLDVEMPGLDGLATLRAIMHQFPRPVLMVSAVTEKDASTTFSALSAGAFDYIPKQMSSQSLDIFHIREALLAKLQLAAHSRKRHSSNLAQCEPSQTNIEIDLSSTYRDFLHAPAVVAIGASTGGPQALQEILSVLPGDLPVPILVVQHMPAGFTAAFANRLNLLCQMQICEAKHGEALHPGVAYIAPAGRHMTIERHSSARPSLHLDAEPQHVLHVPSIDLMMTSVARLFGPRTLGIILTGMGSDGVEGMRAIHEQGGLTIGQDEFTCAVYGMPRACAESGVLTHAVPLPQIPGIIVQATRLRRHAGAM